MGETTARVEDTIRGWISDGTLQPGGKLPSERVLADELSAGRTTVRLVLAKLTAEGLIRAEHGRGYFISSNAEGA
ncbi:DNA-binding GntR family transcriptional regulator [Streptacidiphilus sp. BW17]|jgi:DNA-binding GntR family transcriptional regulator